MKGGGRHNPGQFRWFLHLLGESSWAVARQLHLFYARRPPDKLSKSLPVFFFFLRSVAFQNWKAVVFKRAHIFSVNSAQTLWMRLAHGGFSFPCFQARCGHLSSQAPPLRVARQSPNPPARCSWAPALPGQGSGSRTPGHWSVVPGHHGFGDGASAPGLELF